MNTLNKEELLNKYPVGAKVKLMFMDDPYAPPVGSIGTVKGVDDLGSIFGSMGKTREIEYSS